MGYNDYLLQQIEENEKECEPSIIDINTEWQGTESPSKEFHYSCEVCDNMNCPHWKEYNE